MNSINFLSGNKFPLYRDALVKLQEQIQFLSGLTGIGGNQNYIVTGVVANEDNTISNGLVVINGELLPFQGGGIPSNPAISIKETTIGVNAFGESYPEVYKTRVAVITSKTGDYNFSDLMSARMKSNIELQNLIASGADEPGTVKMWAGLVSKIPQNYRLADGSPLLISEYPKLYENIGSVFGGDGVGSFFLPDLRGKFIVGYQSSDSDYNANGKTGGQKEIFLSLNQMPAHSHGANLKRNGVDDTDTPNLQALVTNESGGAEYDYQTSQAGNGQPHENRPPYFVLTYIIKVK